MTTALGKLFDKLARRQVAALSLAASLVLLITLAVIDKKIAGPTGEGVLDYQTAFTKARTLEILGQWGEVGISLYLRTVWLDYLFPIAFSVCFAAIIAMLVHKKRGAPHKIHLVLITLPFLAAIFDFAENAAQITLVFDTAARPDALFFLMSSLALIKKAFLALTFLTIGYFLVVRPRST